MSRRIADVAAISGLVLLVLAALGVATGDVVTVWTDGPSTVTVPADVEQADDTSSAPIEQGEQTAPDATDNENWLARAAAVVGLALLCWLAVVVVTTWWRIWRERTRRSRPATPTARLEPLDAPLVELHSDVLATAVREGEPRNAIVACWVRLEQAVAEAGHPRRAAETSADYTERVLATSSHLDPVAVRRLAALYREARFSSHPIGEVHRAEALDALATVAR